MTFLKFDMRNGDPPPGQGPHICFIETCYMASGAERGVNLPAEVAEGDPVVVGEEEVDAEEEAGEAHEEEA